MEQITTCQKPFAKSAKDFITKLIAQRNRLIKEDKSRISKYSALQVIDFLNVHLNCYNYSDGGMARFIVNHFSKIQLIVPGEGSGSHEQCMNDLLKIYNQAVVINSELSMKKFTYYKVTSDHGEAFVKTSLNECTVASLSYDGKAEVKQFESSFKKFNGDIAIEITKEAFQAGLKNVVEIIKKEAGI